MTIAWIVFGLAASAALSLAALALEKLLRMQRRATRWVWIVAMAAPLLLAFGGTQTAAPRYSAPAKVDAFVQHASGRDAPARSEFSARTRSWQQSANLDGIAALAWTCGSGALALVLMLSAANVRRRARQVVCVAGQEIAVTDDLGPAVFGLVQPRILVPKWFLTLDAATQRTALMHERQHIAAHDSRLLGAALMLLVAMPWNLPLWWQFRRLRLAIEVDCDARVLRCGHDARAYGETLLSIAEHRSGTLVFAPAINDSPSALEQRIELLFAPRFKQPKLLAAGLTTCVIACSIAAAQVEPPARLVSPAQIAANRSGGTLSRALGRDLIDAAQANDTATARALISEGADVDRIALGDGTPLILAARSGNMELTRALLDGGANPNLDSPGDGNPLIVAAAHGHLDIVQQLIERGADVNATVIGDETPLINAARGGHLAVVKLLVAHGADVNLSAPESRTPLAEIRSPLGEAKKHRQREVIEFLERSGAVPR
jgi:ankyrin repeat protein